MTGLILRARRALALRLCPPLGAELVALAAEVQAHKGAVLIARRAAQGKEALVQRLRAAEERCQAAEARVALLGAAIHKVREMVGAACRPWAASPAIWSERRKRGEPIAVVYDIGLATDRAAWMLRDAARDAAEVRRLDEAFPCADPDPRQGRPGPGAELLPDPGAEAAWQEFIAIRPGPTSPAYVPPPPPAAPPALPAASWHVGFDTACPSRTVLTHVPEGIELRADGKPLQVGDEIRADMKLSAAPAVIVRGLPRCTCATGVCAMHDGVFNAPPPVVAPSVRRHRRPGGSVSSLICVDCGANLLAVADPNGPCPGPAGDQS